MIRLAHLSDPHLGPMPPAGFTQLLGKRALGWFNWHKRRKSFHLRSVVELMVEDTRAAKPDHIAVTGDLVNISLEPEFENAAAWLKSVGEADRVSVVPGNHDAYVPMPWDSTIGRWRDYMTSCAEGAQFAGTAEPFPYVRIVGDVGLIGLSTAVPTLPACAFGRLGSAQLQALEAALAALGKAGFYRVVMIHHPPLSHQASPRKNLHDAGELAAVFASQGVELVLHGHNHRDMHETFDCGGNLAHIFGVPSASGTLGGYRPAAQYNTYTIEKAGDEWRCTVTIRGLNGNANGFETVKELILPGSTNS